MNKMEKKEIQRALMNRVEPAPDGGLQVLDPADFRILGVGDGALAARFLGIGCTECKCECKGGSVSALKTARSCMLDIGRSLKLREQPETVACLIRYVLTRPAVLTFRYEEGVPVLAAWASHGLTGWISRWRAIRAFERHLPDNFTLAERKTRKEKREENRANKQKAKEEKKRLRAEKKARKNPPKEDKKKKETKQETGEQQ